MTTSDPGSAGDGIRLRVLGRVELRTGEGEIRRVLAQPRRLALLLYLVLRRPEGFHRRDHLLGVFWPESSETRGRAALRQAVRFLRRWLGGDVLLSRGDEVGVDRAAITCDATTFRRALEEGRDEDALACYGGDLLPGFFVSGAPAFERWLEAERRYLREAAVEAALRTSDAAAKSGDLEKASASARRALRIDPTDEAAARRLISLLDRSGNRAAAVAAYEALAERLREEFDLDPAPETVALIESLRDRDAPAAATTATTVRDLAPRRVLVLPFENLTGDHELDVLGSMAADWVSRGLADLRELEVVPPTRGFGSARVSGAGSSGRAAEDPRLALANETGAGTIVDGRCYLEGSELRFQPRITDVPGDRLIPGPEPVVVSADSPLDGLEELRRRIVACLAPALSPRATHVNLGARPPSYEAYRAYMEGLELFIAGEWKSALAHFRRSAEVAPGYALPRIVCAIAHWNLGELREAREIASEASGLRPTVGRFEQAVLDMVVAWLRGDWSAAHEAVRLQAELAPGSIPHFQVAEEARRLNRPREARDILVRLDPERGELRGWIFYWIELATAHHLLGDHAAELDAAARARALYPDDPVAILLEIRALAALGRAGAVERRADEATILPGGREPRPGALLHEAALELRAHGHPDAADPLLQRALSWYGERVDATSPDVPRRDFARALYHAGRWERAEAIFRELAERPSRPIQRIGGHHGHLRGHRDEGYLAAIAVRRGDEGEAERWCRRLEEVEGPFLYGSQWFWLAAVAALRDDAARAVSALRRAFSEGLPFDTFLHTDPHLAPLRGTPKFDALLRPRG